MWWAQFCGIMTDRGSDHTILTHASPLLRHTHTSCLRTAFSAHFIPYEAEALFACGELWELPGQADWLTDWSGSFWYWHKVDGRLLLCVFVVCPQFRSMMTSPFMCNSKELSPDVKTFSSARSHYFLLNAFTQSWAEAIFGLFVL